jgi:aldose 1-epimerase
VSAPGEHWGTTAAGEPVARFTLERAGLRAHLSSFGATLVSLEVPDARGRTADVVLGFDALEDYESPRNPYLGAVVGRCANRIAGARFELDGREVRLTANEGPHHLHGGQCGFDRHAWTGLGGRGLVEFRRRSADGEEGYPGELSVRAFYGLGPGVLEHRLLARPSAPTPCSLTQHSYFNLAGEGTILDHALVVRASRVVVVDEALIPTGELAPVAGTPFDFREPRPIGERIAELEGTAMGGYDVCLVLDPGRGPAAVLRDPRSGRSLTIETDQPGLQLYTGNRLGDLRVRGGVCPPRFGALCLEAQGLPDAVHHPHFPSVIVRPPATFRSRTVWRFGS